MHIFDSAFLCETRKSKKKRGGGLPGRPALFFETDEVVAKKVRQKAQIVTALSIVWLKYIRYISSVVKRLLTLPQKHSFFLFGARGTGKSSLLKERLSGKKTLWLDLLDDFVLEKYLLSPQTLRQELEVLDRSERPDWVVIDEVQKAPKLLNVVHQLIESPAKIQFALTGSSGRRLKQKGVNLLAGRAFVKNIFPLTFLEYGKSFDITHALQWGTLPKLLHLKSDEEKADFLRAYTLTYIKSEIQEEQWVRQVDPFRKFLPIAAQMNGKPVNYSSIAREVGVSSLTVQSYYEILEDTLLGFFLSSYHKSVRKQQRQASKFYFFDLGIKRALCRQLSVPVIDETYEFGYIFEHFIICEIFRLNHYWKQDFELSYLQTKDDAEIDLILDRPGMKTALIEIKSAKRIDERDTKTLEAFMADRKENEGYVLSRDPTPKKIGRVLALPWQKGIAELRLGER